MLGGRAQTPRLDRALAVLLPVLGLAFAFVTPPFQVPDEPQHFFRAYGVSEGRWFPAASGDVLPVSLPRVAARLLDDIPFHVDVTISRATIREAARERLASEERAFVPFLTSAYSFVPYLPAAIGIAVARLFSDSVLALLYAGRVASVAVSTLLLVAALRRTAAGRPLFFLLALAPMAMFEMASVSADAFTNSFSFFFTAVMLGAAFGPATPLGRAAGIWLLLAVLLGLAKPAYMFLAGLVFLVPVERFGSAARRAILGLSMLVASAGAALAWSWVIRDVYPPFHGSGGLDPQSQLLHVVEHPLRVIGIAVSFYVREAAVLANQYIGKLGWVDTHLPPVFVVAYFLLLVAVGLTGGWQAPTIRPRQRGVLLTVLLVSLGWMTALLYVVFTPPGASFIGSTQGRYFIPFGPIAFLSLANRRLRVDWNGRLGWLVAAGILAGVVSLVSVARRFYP